MNNSLTDIKNTLKEDIRFTILFPEPLNLHTQAIVDFKKKTDDFHQKLDDCHSEGAVKKLLLALSNDFKNIKKLDGFNEDKNNIHSLYMLLSSKLNIEKPNKYFTEVIKNITSSKNDKFLDVSNDITVQDVIQPFLKKYNFSFFIPEDKSSPKDIIKFLNKFDKEAQAVADDLGVVPSVLGINGTLGLKQTKFNFSFGGEFNSIEKTMTITNRTGKRVILHEWVHAIDNHVARKYLDDKSSAFVSSEESTYVKGSDSPSKAYALLRKMTSELFSLSKSEAANIIAAKEKEVLNKTWSILIGNEWYGLSDKQRGPLFTSQVLNSINNYIINRNGEDTHLIANAIESTGLLTKEKALNGIISKGSIIDKEVLPVFQEIHQNKKGKGSLYYYGSVFSDYSPTRVFRFIQAKMSTDPETRKTSWTNYYSQPEEMLARYFEGQVYQKQVILSHLTNLVFLNMSGFTALSLLSPFVIGLEMKMGKDSSFQKHKDELITHLFGKESLLPKINKVSNLQKIEDFIRPGLTKSF